MRKHERFISGGRATAVLAVLLALGFMLASASASAADQPSSQKVDAASDADSPAALAEIIVTAQKRNEEVIKVPISVSVYDAAMMDQQGMRDIEDVVQMTPGIEFSDDRGASQRIVIRGISSKAGASTSSIYIDDIPVDTVTGILNLIGTTSAKIFDLDRVEVLRGPQGTLFGAGAEGGLIRFITPQPSLTDFSGYTREDVSFTQGGTLSYEAGVAVGGPIKTDELGFRASAWHRQDGGYVDHDSLIPGGDVESNANWTRSDVVRLAVTLAPVESVKITPSIMYQRVKTNDSGFFDPSGSNAADNHFVNENPLSTPINDEFYIPALKVEADLGPVSLTSSSSYIHRKATYTLDYTNVLASIFGLAAAPTIADAAPVAYGNVQDSVSQEVRLQSVDPNARLKWTVGAFFSTMHEQVTENIYNPSLPQMSEQYFGLSVADAFGAPMIGNYSFIATDVLRDRQLAIFSQVDYRIVDGLTAVVGARAARLHTDFDYDAAGPINGGTVSHHGGQDENAVTPKYGLNYQLNDNNLLYVSAAKGNRIGGANTPLEATPACVSQLAQIGAGGTPSSYQSDSLWSYEVGSKNKLFNDRLVIEGSAFYIDWRNIQQSIYVPACLSSFVANVGKATIDGFDLVLNGAVTKHFHVGLNVGYTNAKVAETTGVPGTNIVYAYKGDQLDLFHSPWTLATLLEYAFSVDGRDAFARLDDEYHPRNPGPFTSINHPGPLFSTLFHPNPATNLLNFRTGTYFGKLELTAYVSNLLNSHPSLYDLSALGVGGSALGSTFTFRPRTFGVNSVYRW